MTIAGQIKRFRDLLGIKTIRTRLMLAFVLVVLVVAVAIGSVTMVIGARDGRQREISQLESVAALKQAEIESWVNWLHINLKIFISGEGELSDVRLLTSQTEVKQDYLQNGEKPESEKGDWLWVTAHHAGMERDLFSKEGNW